MSSQGTYCAPCEVTRQQGYYRRNRAKVLAAQSERYAADPNFHKDKRVKGYGLPPGAYQSMLDGQGGRCAICRTDEPGGPAGRRFCFDHDHRCCPATKACAACVRGLLCFPCNIALGKFRDNPEILAAAIAYLRVATGGTELGQPPADNNTKEN